MRTEKDKTFLLKRLRYSVASRRWITSLGGRQCGFTLVELLVAVVVIATLAGIAMLVASSYQELAKTSKAIGDIAILENRIEKHLLNNGVLPSGLADLEESSPLDSWGRPYEYANYDLVPPGQRRKDKFLVPLNTSYDLYSKGKDGKSSPPITASASQDDIIRANDGNYVGLASNY
jgi:general secretion pathway protein G